MPLTKLPPHAGYHGAIARRNQPFFEGWYFRVIPKQPPLNDRNNNININSIDNNNHNSRPSLAFIFHVFDPNSPLSKRQGVGMQVITPQGTVLVETPHVSRFQADSRELNVFNQFSSTQRRRGQRQRQQQRSTATATTATTTKTKNNDDTVDFFRLTARNVAGRASTSSWYSTSPTSTDDSRKVNGERRSSSNNNRNVSSPSSSSSISSVSFNFDVLPYIGWGGGVDARQYSTAGWLAAFPIFEPHYQVLISKGIVSSGHLTVEMTRQVPPNAVPTLTTTTTTTFYNYNLTDATVYLEKNWGASFPSAWWWIQANTFVSQSSNNNNNNNNMDDDNNDDDEDDLCVTSTGAKRRLPLLRAREEEVALIGLHWKGQFLPFPTVQWNVQWGTWQVSGSYQEYSVELMGTCCPDRDQGVPIRCPTPDGMKEIAVETFQGTLRVQLYHQGTLVLDKTSYQACLEIGGGDSRSGGVVWKGESAMVEPIKSIAMNVELERSVSDVLQVLSRFVTIPGL
jgi:Tocopherol cyclase